MAQGGGSLRAGWTIEPFQYTDTRRVGLPGAELQHDDTVLVAEDEKRRLPLSRASIDCAARDREP